MLVAVFIHGPGTIASQPDLLERASWIADQLLLWKAGWIFWFAPTLSFSWSYQALGRHLDGVRQWRDLAIGLALIAAAVDIVGVLLNFTVLPELARELAETLSAPDPPLLVLFQALEMMANNLTNVGGFGLYSLAGIVLLPAVFATVDLSRPLSWLGALEWMISIIATALLIVAPELATGPLVISFLLYAPWVWGGWNLAAAPSMSGANWTLSLTVALACGLRRPEGLAALAS
ncbi:MAG: hypothetical protein R3300_09170 [Candidatus Promineifilaceae bacterium]|nr:hypothetical protein [Candidatus Promineifilaceae bacterium]